MIFKRLMDDETHIWGGDGRGSEAAGVARNTSRNKSHMCVEVGGPGSLVRMGSQWARSPYVSCQVIKFGCRSLNILKEVML